MIGLLAYGSLMHPDELARHFAGEGPLLPVRVRGFRRSFCQEPSWRQGSGERRGVLTVRPSAVDWINAVLVCGCGPDVLRSLDHRERGYRRVAVPAAAIDPYAAADAVRVPEAAAVYAGRDDKWNPSLLPNDDYAALCTRAAGHWGAAFLDDFLATTYLGGETLAALGISG